MIADFFSILLVRLIAVKKCEVVIAPPVMYLDMVRRYLKGSRIMLCAQNVDINIFGACTGDISAEMLKDLNTQYVLIGHSERRMYHKESNLYIAKKFSILKKIGLVPILCIGENQKEHDAGHTHMVCVKQIDEIIRIMGGVDAFENTVIAYEPMWAIGSGIHPIPENVQKIHKFIRNYIAQYDAYIARKVLLQYGGSVTSKNVIQFLSQDDIDGVLVGTASLNVNSFVDIVQIVEKYKW